MRKKIVKYDIFKTDNYLIKIGYFVLIFSVIFLFSSIIPKIHRFDSEEFYMKTGIFTFVFLGSISMLVYGYSVRIKENKINAILRNLQIAMEVSVTELLENTSYTAQELEEAIIVINSRGLGYYVWNKSTGTISDGRLRRKMIFVDKCTSCGQSIGKSFPITLDKIPECSYCGNHLDINHWNELKQHEIENITKENRENENKKSESDFSLWVFLILAIIFWPGAIVYIIVKKKKFMNQFL